MRDFEEKIKKCKKCFSLGCSCPVAPISFTGESYDGTVLIGESPHKVWIESGNPFHAKNGIFTPSAKRIFEYLGLLGKVSENVILLEAAKCVVKDRKQLPVMIKNCREHLEFQLNNYHPRLVISFGKTVCDELGKLWGVKVTPCNQYQLSDFIYMPLFHPSPINPENHKKNLEFLKNINT